jgi:ribonuclease BN (tRNA processing enzyme)
LEDTNMKIHPLNRPEVEIAGHKVRIWSQRHPGGSIGIRIDDAIAYVSDTVVMMENVEQVKGVSLLLHELWLNDEDAAAQEKEANRHACFAPIHLYPHYTDEALTRMAHALQDVSGVPVLLPVEGKVSAIKAG